MTQKYFLLKNMTENAEVEIYIKIEEICSIYKEFYTLDFPLHHTIPINTNTLVNNKVCQNVSYLRLENLN